MNDHAAHPTPAPPLAVRMAGIRKRFGPVLANDDVTLEVASGTVHALVGENGAGKSTLMSLLYGLHSPDAGTIEVFGKPAQLRSTHDAIAMGLGMVHQHFMLVDSLTALENVMLGAEPHALLARAERMVRPRLQTLMESTGLRVDLDARVGDLPVGDRQRLEILKVLFRGAKVLILDEPTAVLTPQEAQHLFGVLSALRSQGTTIILITHKLDEVMRLADRVTVMRGGRVVHECSIGDTSPAQLAESMVGRKVNIGRPVAQGAVPGEVVLEASGLKVVDAMGVTRLHGLDLALRAGQIVGVAGVSGNGQSELLEVLSGLRVPQAGSVRLAGETFAPTRWLTPRTARRLHLAHVPEDRHARAMVLDFAAWESGILGYEGLLCYSGGGFLRRRRMREDTRAMMERFDVRPRAPELASGNFSGGNQQKLVLARELGQAPRVLIVGQPTRGVDIGAIEFIHGQLRQMREAGCAILLVSSELDEILALADRVVVMNSGRITGERAVEACTEAELGLLMAHTEAPKAEALA
ncbi:ABC transporter ATP-binding protein [Usitatibacter palustris]|uniref:Ribose import ATP-binding protein RbsA n=1 Tax=Usitatibacter palustris TaxID=2732487 RepID=A0A6M4H6W9_9PROT|nr:ABC transporter ATP-binding protein [Usitatibacter palustris]QJR15280.1 Ribose import ATP-binding protein RbsA [Usitatibacter palustris]